MSDTGHRVLKLWVRPDKGGPLVERETLEVESDRGIVGDHTLDRLRHVTIVFEDDWAAATREIGRDVDPIERRANVLVSGGCGERHVGSRIRLGPLELDVKGVVTPCNVMDRAAAGLCGALMPEGRAGIWGRVLRGGTLRRGDELGAAADPVDRG